MSLSEHLDELLSPAPFRCKFVRMLDAARQAEPDDVARLEQARESGAITSAQAATALSRAGYRVSEDTAQKHARGTCGCDT